MTPADWFEAFAAGARLATNAVGIGAGIAVTCALVGIGGVLARSALRSGIGVDGHSQRAAVARGKADAWDWPARPADTYERKDVA